MELGEEKSLKIDLDAVADAGGYSADEVKEILGRTCDVGSADEVAEVLKELYGIFRLHERLFDKKVKGSASEEEFQNIKNREDLKKTYESWAKETY